MEGAHSCFKTSAGIRSPCPATRSLGRLLTNRRRYSLVYLTPYLSSWHISSANQAAWAVRRRRPSPDAGPTSLRPTRRRGRMQRTAAARRSLTLTPQLQGNIPARITASRTVGRQETSSGGVRLRSAVEATQARGEWSRCGAGVEPTSAAGRGRGPPRKKEPRNAPLQSGCCS